MVNQHCMLCSGTFKTATGEPCPVCCDKVESVPIVAGVPVQYQGVKFDKSFLPLEMQGTYGEFMETLMTNIINDIAFYQKNILICSRPNSGKTVWAYSLISLIMSKGYGIPQLKDLMEVRAILNNYSDKEANELISTARCVVIKIPLDVQFWMFDILSSIVERRVRSNGFTIFLYGGTDEELRYADKNNKLKYILGSGAYNSIKLESFR